MKNILSIQSHVVFGHAGNSASEFPMRRMGVNVWPLNTVQFSNHTQYPENGLVVLCQQNTLLRSLMVLPQSASSHNVMLY